MTQPTLYMSPPSPFARRVRLALRFRDIPYQEKPVFVWGENPTRKEMESRNPFGSVPTFITSDGVTLIDSTQILEYLGVLPKSWEDRNLCVLVSELMLSMTRYYQEKAMHEVPNAWWVNEHLSIITDAMNFLCRTPSTSWIRDGKLTQAGWDIACAIEYMEFRIPEFDWKSKFPPFEKILLLARENRHFVETKPAPPPKQ